ncbi:hypothetical protein W04_2686 [Pseudoalteromonas sp. SW0106-04]|nr:hypothetical protein W04_2686 [Pseudoalteromonas sp. SW0106-04]
MTLQLNLHCCFVSADMNIFNRQGLLSGQRECLSLLRIASDAQRLCVMN